TVTPYRLTVTEWARSAGSVVDAVDVVDPVNRAHGFEDVTQMLGVAHLESEPARGDPVTGGGDRGGQDVHVVVRQDPGDVGQQPGPIEGLDLDGDQED